MKKCFFILMVALIAIGALFVSCKNEVQIPAEELVSVSFENGSARALSSNLEGFAPETYYWKYAAKKADASNLVSGETSTYDEAGAKWIKEGSQGLGTPATQTTPYESYKVQGFSQGLWNFKLFAYKDAAGTQIVYSGETTGVLLQTNGNHRVDVVVSPAQSGNGTLVVKITGDDKIVLNPASGSLIPNTKIRLGIEKIGETSPIRALDFITEDYNNSALAAGTYKVTVQFTNDDATVIYAAGSVVSTVYSNLTSTIKGSLNEVVTYADFGAEQNPDIITTTIGTTAITQGTTSSTVNFTSTTETKVTASMPTAAAKSLIAAMEQQLDAKTSTSESTTSDLTLNLSVNTTEATETTITYEIGMEATLVYEKKDAAASVKTTTKSNVETLDDFVIVKIELQRGLSDVSVMHAGTAMVECASLSELTGKDKTSEGAAAGFYFYQDPYLDNNVAVTTKAMLYIKTYTFSPFQLSYTVPSYVASVGDKRYQTLTEAISAAEAGETILILKDITTDDGYEINKNLSIDTDGHTITVKNGSNINNRAFRIDSGKLTVFGGGTIVSVGSGTTSSNGAGCYGAFRVEENGELEVSDMTLTNARPWGLNVKVLGGKATLTNVTINSSYGGGIEVTEKTLGGQSKKGSATLTDCTFTQTGHFDHCSTTLSVSGGSELIVNSGSYTSDNYALYVFSSGGVITVNGGTFSGNKDGVAIVAAIDTNTYPQYTGGLAISGGTFTGGYSITSPAYMSITGGTYSVNPSAYVADGYKAVKDGVLWHVVQKTGNEEVYITGTSYSGENYMTFAEFRNSVNAGNGYADCTVTLLQDIDLAEISWTPIGTKTHPFRGTFDGAGHTINNLSNHGFTAETFDAGYDSGSENAFALFGYLRGNVTIKNLNAYVYAADASGKGYAGIVGLLKNDDEVPNTSESICTLNLKDIKVYGRIVAKDKVAGIIAQVPHYADGDKLPLAYQSSATIDGCENHANLYGNRVGGILAIGSGIASGTCFTHISNSKNYGNLTAPINGSYSVAAGIIAQTNTTDWNYFTVENCSNNGTLTASIAYGLTTNVFFQNPSAETYGTGNLLDSGTVYTHPARLYAEHDCFTGDVFSAVRWKDIEGSLGKNNELEGGGSNTDLTGLFAGVEYNKNGEEGPFVAQYVYNEGDVTYTFKFTSMDEALSRFRTNDFYTNLTLLADAEWKAEYTKKGDGPGNYSIDLNTHTLTLSAPIHTRDSNYNGLQKYVGIKNGTIAFKEGYSGYIFDHIERNGRVDFSNVILNNTVTGKEIISIYPSTAEYDGIKINFDAQCEGFYGSKIRCLSPNTGGGDLLILNGDNITMSDSRWVADEAEKVLTITFAVPENKQVLITKAGETADYKSLAEFRELVNEGNSFSGYTVTLQCDVATGSDWVPIGNSNNPFSGVFDGAYHTISMNYEDTSKEDIALFGVVSNGTVKRLTVTGTVHARRNVAGIIVKLTNNSSAIGLTNYAAVTAELDKCGGVMCTTYSYSNTVTVEDCSNYGIVKCLGNNANTQCIAGGIVGFCSQNGKVTITNCKNYGTIMCDKATSDGATNAGSIVGHIAKNSIENTEKTVILSGCANVSSGEPSGKMVQKTYTIVGEERVYDKNEESITCLVGYITNPTEITLVVDGTTCTSSGAGTDYPYNSYTPVN